jgi:hypothetical protein
MRFGVGSAWTSLTGLGALLVAAGCQMPVPEEGSDVDDKQPDPNQQYSPGTDPTINPERPPGSYEQPPMSGTSAPRKLALDLNGVAGFAILDEAGQEGSLGLHEVDGLAPAGGDSAAFLRLESNASGQVLTRSLDGLSRQQLLRNGLGVPELAQEDPSGGAPLPSSGDATAPAPDAAPQPEVSAGEQAGLLKITADGQIVPALVELAAEPAPSTSEPAPAPTGEAPPPPSGSEPQPAPAPTGTSVTGSSDAPIAGPTGPMSPPREPLPRVTALGLSPDGSVYVLFERGFFYRQPTAEEMTVAGAELYGPLSPLRCQLFRADGSWREGAPEAAALAELECVTNEHEVPTWDTRRVMQFDAAGRLYFRAVTRRERRRLQRHQLLPLRLDRQPPHGDRPRLVELQIPGRARSG